MSVLDSIVTDLNKVIDNRAVATAVTTSAVVGVLGALSRLVIRYVRHRRSVSVTTIFDQAVNIQTQSIKITASRGSGAEPGPSQEEGTVESIVILRIANSGTERIALESVKNDRFRIHFPGRTILVIKVREPDELVGEPGRPLPPDRFNSFRKSITTDTALPPDPDGRLDPSRLVVPDDVILYRKEAFQLAVFLSGTATDPKDKVVVRGELDRGRIIYRHNSAWRRAWPVALPAALVLGLALSFGVGALTANRALTPRATCVGDLPLNIEGSTAFAHVATEAVTDYEQLCPAARITITADGSDAAISNHRDALPNDTVLMVDYSGQTAPANWKPNPVGMVIFGVVVNKAYPNAVAGSAYALRTGYGRADLANLYRDASAGKSVPFAAVGRDGSSGTAAAFDSWTGLDNAVLTNAGGCPPISATAASPGAAPTFTGLCDVGTTQKMLDFVNDNPNAIGFADIDAVTQYPSLSALPIDGVQPDRANVLDGSYRFTTPEYLYTTQNPSSQLSAFLSFLRSPAETAQLAAQDAGFIPCSGLSGAVAGDCTATQ